MKIIIFTFFILSLIDNSSGFIGNIFGNIFPKKQCPIKLYNPKDPSFTGIKIYANAETFHPLLQTLSDYAKRCHVKINVKRAFEKESLIARKTYTNDRSTMAFQVGEGIEFDILDENNRLLCDEFCMGKSLSHLKRLPNAKCLLRKISKNRDLQRDFSKSTLLTKRMESDRSLNDEQINLRKNCKHLHLN